MGSSRDHDFTQESPGEAPGDQRRQASTRINRRPPIRWAGGKRLLANRLRQFLPAKYGSYYEPMVGSGALFFSIAPEQAYLADINPELMNFYHVLKNHPKSLYSAISSFAAEEATYYSLRAWTPAGRLERAARFLYLVRLSWNGLYRVNRYGHFNVPYGYRRPKELLSWERMQAASLALRNAHFGCGDFEITTVSIRPGDLLYLDPPYPKGAAKGNGFARYNETGFTLEDHMRLARWVSHLANRGVHILITEAARKEILALFPKDFRLTLVRSSSLIAADSGSRRDAYEAILTSYPV